MKYFLKWVTELGRARLPVNSSTAWSGVLDRIERREATENLHLSHYIP